MSISFGNILKQQERTIKNRQQRQEERVGKLDEVFSICLCLGKE